VELIRLLFQAPHLFLVLTVPLLYSVILHEVAHGWCARAFGDDTAARRGRLTLNPLPHLDPVGLLMLLFVGFGWAKPVPVSYANLHPVRAGAFCVALAGCATNLLLAATALAALQAGLAAPESLSALALAVAARINLILAALNLLPIPPLDGSKVLLSLLPAGSQRVLLGFERYGFLILILLLLAGWLDPLIRAMEQVLLGLLALVFGRGPSRV
jgi:Zn-dependent protease